jgi:hypothetical protein
MQNPNGYDFGLYAYGSVKVRPVKYPDRTIELVVEGLGKSSLVTRGFTTSAPPPVIVLCLVTSLFS